MDEGFELPVMYKGKELMFPAELVLLGWTQRIVIDVEGAKVAFERDEERQWRALIAAEDLEASKKVDIELLKVIADTIENILA